MRYEIPIGGDWSGIIHFRVLVIGQLVEKSKTVVLEETLSVSARLYQCRQGSVSISEALSVPARTMIRYRS